MPIAVPVPNDGGGVAGDLHPGGLPENLLAHLGQLGAPGPATNGPEMYQNKKICNAQNICLKITTK